jgi:hypothetical protein
MKRKKRKLRRIRYISRMCYYLVFWLLCIMSWHVRFVLVTKGDVTIFC